MAEKQNPGYIEQLREMRALRTQQLRGMNADQRFYTNLNANQRALVLASQKLGASFDSMSKTFSSSLRGLSSAVGGLASKGASAAGSVAGGAASITGSLVSGIGKVLPFAIAGLLGKIFVYDNLTSDTKSRLSSSIGNLFSTLFGGLPDMFKGIIQKIVDSVSKMDIKFPILNTIMEKTEILMKMFGAGIELAKLKFEDLMEFFEGIKDPMKIFESGLKAIGAATLSRLLLPATVSLVASIIGNRLLMGQIGDALDSRGVGGRRGGGVISPSGGGRRAGRPSARGGSKAGIMSGLARAVGMGLRAGSATVALAIPVFNVLALSYTAYELYEIAKELGFGEDDANELSRYEEAAQTKATAYIETRNPEENLELDKLLGERNKNDEDLKTIPDTTGSNKKLRASIIQRQAAIAKRVDFLAGKSKINKDLEEKQERKEVFEKFYSIWNILDKNEKLYAIEEGIPIVETENFVYFMGKDRKTIVREPVEVYLKKIRDLPEIEIRDREEFQLKLAGVIIPAEAPVMGYDQPFAKDKKGTPFVPLPEGKKLTTMTGKEVLDYQKKQVEATKAAGIGIRNGKVVGTGAMGAYQINQENLKEYYDDPKNAGEEDKLFDAEQQDKIYRYLIKGAVDKFMVDGDTEKFAKYVTDTWEIFKKDSPGGKEARKQLDALLNTPAFTEVASKPTNRLNKEQRAARQEILTGMFGKFTDQLMAAGDTTIATAGGKDVVKEVVKKTKGILETQIDEAMDFFQNLKPNNDATELKTKDDKVSQNVTQNITNAPVSVVASSSGGGGGAPSGGSVISGGMRDRNWQFHSLAGGNQFT